MTFSVGLILIGAVLLYAGIKGASVVDLLLGKVSASRKPQAVTR